MSDRASSWKEWPLWKEAEALYQRWKNEEFDLDEERATRLNFRSWTETTDDKGRKKKLYDNGSASLSEYFAGAMSNWPARRESPNAWVEAAREVVNVYTVTRTRNCLVPGLSIRRGIQERERQVADLSAELQETKAKLAEEVRRLKECNDRTVELETENQKLRERNPVFGIAQGSVDEVGEDASKKEDEE